MNSPQGIFEQAITAGAFPGASFWLGRGEQAVLRGAVGTLGYEAPFDVPVTEGTLYDLASVTKLYTLAAVLLAADEGGVDLCTARVREFLPEFPEPFTLVHLLQHTSGLGVEIQSLHEVEAGEWVPRIAAAKPRFEPGTQVLYSCTNYFLLARVVEKIAGDSLDEVIESRLLKPAELTWTKFVPVEADVVAPTEARPEGGHWCGVVHDEAARSWREQTGTCAGNAGLFATAADVAAFGRLWLEENEIVPGRIRDAVWVSPVVEKSFRRAWGWQLDAAFYMGELAPPETSGHTGFTGPTLVLNRKTGHLAVLLSNRVHPTRNGPDRLPFYRQLHDWLFRNHCAEGGRT